MKYFLVLLTLFVMPITGCAESSALIARSSINERTDVFEEQRTQTPVPAGYVDLKITAILKTHLPGAYSATDIHGTQDYNLLVNIDGQAMHLRGSRQNEYRQDLSMTNPESGNGTKYLFHSYVRLKEGSHKVVVAIPADKIAVEKELILKAGKTEHLLVEPIYGSKSKKLGINKGFVESFAEGIKTFRVMLNGLEI
ncbi:hypothetical protein M1B72_09550 [Geomonas paludis]|uniref:Lipoprotein n=1 Tax=Geomonas paludis TaxID=2740185 RepID=A0ABY4LJ99_9BACT|nr:hypothetical protein [Geomonas paludis]UPU37932.1 hypothetical protein M1B72_09550 [Geomonas paludis]